MIRHQTGMPDLSGISIAELRRRRDELSPVLARVVGVLDRGAVVVSRFQSAIDTQEDA